MIQQTFEISLSNTLLDLQSKKTKSFTYTLPEQKPEELVFWLLLF